MGDSIEYIVRSAVRNRLGYFMTGSAAQDIVDDVVRRAGESDDIIIPSSADSKYSDNGDYVWTNGNVTLAKFQDKPGAIVMFIDDEYVATLDADTARSLASSLLGASRVAGHNSSGDMAKRAEELHEILDNQQ